MFPNLPADASLDITAAIPHLSRSAVGVASPGPGRALDLTTLRAPILDPPHNIMCVGKNYRAHAREFTRSGFDSSAAAGADAIPEYPIIFTKPATSIAGPHDDVPLWPGLDTAIDYEAELAVVIGRGGRFIRRADAMAHVFGYMVLNDVTARDLQREHKQWFLGKGIAGSARWALWITTPDEIDVSAMRLTCRVNGEMRQDASTADLIFDVPTLIETISRSVTLSPGMSSPRAHRKA